MHEYILIFSFYLLLLLAAAAAAMVMFMVMVVVGAPVALTIRTCALGVSVCQKFDNESAEVCLSTPSICPSNIHIRFPNSLFWREERWNIKFDALFWREESGTLNSKFDALFWREERWWNRILSTDRQVEY